MPFERRQIERGLVFGASYVAFVAAFGSLALRVVELHPKPPRSSVVADDDEDAFGKPS
jgi:hypothetical protein